MPSLPTPALPSFGPPSFSWLPGRRDTQPAPVDGLDPKVETVEPPELIDVAFALNRPELHRFETGLRDVLQLRCPPLDSPDRLRAALGLLIGDIAAGSVTVERYPAGLQAAEYWHIRLAGVTAVARDAIEPLARAARNPR